MALKRAGPKIAKNEGGIAQGKSAATRVEARLEGLEEGREKREAGSRGSHKIRWSCKEQERT